MCINLISSSWAQPMQKPKKCSTYPANFKFTSHMKRVFSEHLFLSYINPCNKLQPCTHAHEHTHTHNYINESVVKKRYCHVFMWINPWKCVFWVCSVLCFEHTTTPCSLKFDHFITFTICYYLTENLMTSSAPSSNGQHLPWIHNFGYTYTPDPCIPPLLMWQHLLRFSKFSLCLHNILLHIQLCTSSLVRLSTVTLCCFQWCFVGICCMFLL
jgi:hypothetical protein